MGSEALAGRLDHSGGKFLSWFSTLELAATLDNTGENLSPAFSSELGLMSRTFSPTRGCVLLLPR